MDQLPPAAATIWPALATCPKPLHGGRLRGPSAPIHQIQAGRRLMKLHHTCKGVGSKTTRTILPTNSYQVSALSSSVLGMMGTDDAIAEITVNHFCLTRQPTPLSGCSVSRNLVSSPAQEVHHSFFLWPPFLCLLSIRNKLRLGEGEK